MVPISDSVLLIILGSAGVVLLIGVGGVVVIIKRRNRIRKLKNRKSKRISRMGGKGPVGVSGSGLVVNNSSSGHVNVNRQGLMNGSVNRMSVNLSGTNLNRMSVNLSGTNLNRMSTNLSTPNIKSLYRMSQHDLTTRSTSGTNLNRLSTNLSATNLKSLNRLSTSLGQLNNIDGHVIPIPIPIPPSPVSLASPTVLKSNVGREMDLNGLKTIAVPTYALQGRVEYGDDVDPFQ